MLAIVIPFFKIDFFLKTLQSLDNQTNKNFNVYICNDNSPDNLEFLLKKFQNKFNSNYHKFENNLGSISLTQHWHRCIDLVHNEQWVMILGDDDILSENVVQEFYNNIDEVETLKINVIRYSTFKIDENDQKKSIKYTNQIIEKSTDFFIKKTRSSLSEYVFKKDKINQVRFKDFPLAWNSDVLAVLEFSDFSNVFSINDAFLEIRISSKSISGQTFNSELKCTATFKFYEYLVNKKLNYFSNKQKIVLMNDFNKIYINDKKKLNVFFKINFIYLKIKNYSGLINFHKSIVKSLVDKF